MATQTVQYHANVHGYTVQIVKGTETLDEYNFGNNPCDSVAWLDPRGPYPTVPLETLRKQARQTALELAAELKIPTEAVYENTDLLEDEMELATLRATI